MSDNPMDSSETADKEDVLVAPKTLIAKDYVKKSLRKYPHLHEVLGDNFDYAGFCRTIDNDAVLPAHLKTAYKAIFNPNKRIGSAFTRIFKQYMEQRFAASVPLAENDELRDMWKEVWSDTREKYAANVKKYDQKIAVKNAKRKIAIDPAQQHAAYPYAVPDIVVLPIESGNAFMMWGGGEAKLSVTKGFLKLPDDEKKGILYHEARHGFEPVIANVDINRWPLHRMTANLLTLNAASRAWEYKADDNAAAFGHAESLARAMGHCEELSMPAAKQSLEYAHRIAKAAVDNGFSINHQKAMSLLKPESEIRKPIKRMMLFPIVHLGKIATIRGINKGIRIIAEQSPEERLKALMNPTIGPIIVIPINNITCYSF